MMWIGLLLLSQSSQDTLRWYDTTVVNYIGVGSGWGYLHWAISLPIDSTYDGRIVHSGRVHIWEAMDSSCIMRLCKGGYRRVDSVIDSGSFHPTGYGFYEVFFSDSLVLHEGDTVWLWCTMWRPDTGLYPVTSTDGWPPPVWGFSDLFSMDGGLTWMDASAISWWLNWIMEVALVPSDVQESPPPGPPEELSLMMASSGFLISGYEGPISVYDATGRFLLSRDVKGKTLIGPLDPGVYFVRAGGQRGRIAVLR